MTSSKRGVLGIVFGIVVLSSAAMGACIVHAKLERIQPGHVGVSVRKCSGGGVSQEPIPTGYYWRELFCEDVIEYPISMQSLILTKSPQEGDPEDQSITVTSSEGLKINLDIALNFTLDAKQVPAIYERWRSDIRDISHKYIRQTIREGLQLTFAKYTAEELYSTKKEIARTEAEEFMHKRLEPLGFVISQFTINRIEPPDQVIQAINNKVAMVQQAQQSEQEVRKKQAEAAQQVAVAKGEADAMRTRAEGEAQAIELRADAQAKANRILAESVTPQLVEYEKAIKWDGKLPTMTGGGVTPMIQIK
jgi:regulator of protease activity HflC (stomatin/prohibitin superfamily)